MALKNSQILGGNFAYLLHPFEYFLTSMQQLNIHAIEFYAAAPHLYLEDFTFSDVQKLRAQLDDAGISVKCFTPEQCNYPISLATGDVRMRQRSLRYYEKSLEVAAELGAPLMQMISGTGLLNASAQDNWKRSKDGIEHIVRRAESYHITVVLEADPNCTVSNTQKQLAMMAEIPSPNLAGMIDTNALAINGEDFCTAVKLMGGRLRHIHFIDIDLVHNRFCLVPGEGILPMENYIKLLDAAGYCGSITPELWGGTYLHEATPSMSRAVQFLRNAIKCSA